MKIVFLTYLNRSGSTYLANQLSKSPEICICPESEILYELLLIDPFREFLSDKKQYWFIINELEKDKKFAHWKLNRVEIYDLINTCQNNLDVFVAILTIFLEKNKPGASVILYKDTRLIDLIPKIPESLIKTYDLKWIALIRDIRAIYLSQSSVVSPFTGKPMCTNWYSLVVKWKSFIKQLVKYEKLNYFSWVKYEDLILDPPMTLTNVTASLGTNYQLNWIADKEGEIYETLLPEYRAIHTLIDQMPDKSRIYRWRQSLSPSKQDILNYFCIRNNRKLGYYSESDSFRLSPRHYPEIIGKKIDHSKLRLKTHIKRSIKKCFKQTL
jgi:hypothetical protein